MGQTLGLESLIHSRRSTKGRRQPQQQQSRPAPMRPKRAPDQDAAAEELEFEAFSDWDDDDEEQEFAAPSYGERNPASRHSDEAIDLFLSARGRSRR